MAVNDFYIQWWYNNDTRLGIYFNNFGLDSSTRVLTSGNSQGLNYLNGLKASLSENYRIKNVATEHPIESGSVISDHIISKPDIFVVEGVISSLDFLPIGGLSFSRLGKAVDVLINLARRRKGLSLVTGLTYGSISPTSPKSKYFRVDNLFIADLDLPRNPSNGLTTLKFTITFQRMNITARYGGVTPSSFTQAYPEDIP